LPPLVEDLLQEQLRSTGTMPATNQQSPPPTNHEGLIPTAPPALALLPPFQIPRQEDTSGPMEVIPEGQEILDLINLINKQFDIFVCAREAQNTRSMRMLLSQAATTQEMIADLAGREEATRLCQDWIPPDELTNLERNLHQQTNSYVQQTTPIHDTRLASSLSIAPHPSHQLLMDTQTPEQPDFQHRAHGVDYRDPTRFYDQLLQRALPPPPQQQMV
ncbi:hypothetical protein PTTG_10365, partial [Puccinia triticina 1-1 BBBD Race 1]